MKRPEIGDTVILTGTVKYGSIDGWSVLLNGSKTPTYICHEEMKCAQVIPKPWEPKVGDIVCHKDGSPSANYKVLHIEEEIAMVKAINFPINVPAGIVCYSVSRLKKCVV